MIMREKHRQLGLFILVVFSIIVTGAIAHAQSSQGVTFGQRSSTRLVWPLPPEKPRIQFLYAFSGKEDFHIEKPWWKRVINFLFGGANETAHLIRPQGITVDEDGRIYVTDPGVKGFHIFDFQHNEYKLIRGGGSIALISPIGIAVAPTGTIYVTDSELHAVLVFDHDGRYRFAINDGLQRPTGIWLDKGLLYVSDTGANQIVAFDMDGREKSCIGRRGTANCEFNFPVYLCTAEASNGEGTDRLIDRLYIVDAMNFRLQILRCDGTFVSQFGRLGNGVGEFSRPKGVALDSEGHIYIVDSLFDVVQIFDQAGKLLMALGGSGSGFGNFYLPTGISIDSHDRIYIVDSGNRRIQVFQYV